jgi:hypothetical protein
VDPTPQGALQDVQLEATCDNRARWWWRGDNVPTPTLRKPECQWLTQAGTCDHWQVEEGLPAFHSGHMHVHLPAMCRTWVVRGMVLGWWRSRARCWRCWVVAKLMQTLFSFPLHWLSLTRNASEKQRQRGSVTLSTDMTLMLQSQRHMGPTKQSPWHSWWMKE